MIKTLQTTLKQDKERFKVPRSVQDIIPIRRLWPDGIFQFGSKYSKTMRFSDINYAIASKEDKTAMFLSYSELLNALDTGSTTKITINNKRINRHNFEQEILIPPQGDFLDGGRAEYNAILLDKVTDSSNSVVQERYITLSAHKKNIEEARTFFDRTMGDAVSRLNHMDSRCEELDSVERLRILHDFYRVGEETQFRLDLADCMKNGRFFKDAICPDSMEFKKDHFVMGNKYGRVLFLKEYASYIKDSMINELTSLNRSLMLSIDIIPVPTDEAVREMQNRLLGVETNVTNWQRRQNANNNFSAVVPYDLEQQRKETREMLDDLTTRDQRMMFAVVTLVHLADSKEELDSDTETLQSITRKHLCQLTTLNWQQADGLVTALPLGLRRIDALRTLTTEALAVLMPFKAQEIWDRGGVYYGQNAISKNLIVADRRQLLNGNAFILGVSGSGKSFSAKKEMVSLALSTQDDIIVIDPESEYRPLIEGLGGQVINISATSPNHINVSRDLFNQVQQEMTRRSSKRKVLQKSGKTELGKYSGKYALTELLVCGECGSPYKRVTWARNGEKRIVWRCVSRLEFGTKYCQHSPTLDEGRLHSAILAAMNEYAAIRQEVCPDVLAMAEEAKQALSQAGARLLQLKKRMDAVSREQSDVLDRLLVNMADTELNARMKALTDEKESLKAQIADAQQAEVNLEEQAARRRQMWDSIMECAAGYTEFDNELVRQVIQKITVEDAETIHIHFRDSDVVLEQEVE